MSNTTHRGITGTPWSIWLILLVLAALSECSVMLILPLILPSDTSRLAESIVDTLLLSALISPLLWWLVVRPLREAVRFRDCYMAQLMTRIEEERSHIAQELHDSVGQSLTLLVSGLKSLQIPSPEVDVVQRSADLQKLGQQSLKDIRQIMLGLRPTILDDLGLAPALHRLAEDTMKQCPLKIQVDCGLAQGERLAQQLEIALFRIVQESITNVIKHSHAQEMTIRLQLHGTSIFLDIADNGCGMDARQMSKLWQPNGQLGLIGMQERINLLNGEFKLRSIPGKGTQVSVRIPLEKNQHG